MNAQDIINTLADQRNAALNELAYVKAENVALKRQLEELKNAQVDTGPLVHLEVEQADQTGQT